MCISTLRNEVVLRKHGLKNLLFTSGGRIAEVSKPMEAASATVVAIRNLPYEWTERDVMELLEEHSYVQSVVMRKNR